MSLQGDDVHETADRSTSYFLECTVSQIDKQARMCTDQVAEVTRESCFAGSWSRQKRFLLTDLHSRAIPGSVRLRWGYRLHPKVAGQVAKVRPLLHDGAGAVGVQQGSAHMITDTGCASKPEPLGLIPPVGFSDRLVCASVNGRWCS